MQVRSLGWEGPLEKGMATHSGILAWRIPWTEEPGGLQPIGSQRVGHDWGDLAQMYPQLRQNSNCQGFLCLPHAVYRRRQWQPTPVLLPGKSHGRRSLVGCSPWGRTESDTTEATSLSLFTFLHWRRKWQPTPVFLPGESQGWGSLPSMGSHRVGHDWSDLATVAACCL